MKNIYLLPTEKASRLGYLTKKGKEVFNDLRLFDTLMPNILDSENQHIYITDNSDIKDCWVLNIHINELYFLKGYYGIQPIAKKIILTTDPYLISDGIQAIDEDFLQWFVKNPSCEYVEVKKGKLQTNDDGQKYGFPDMSLYEIIIPQEEPKQETLEEAAERILEENYAYTDDSGDRVYYDTQVKQCIIDGAKWQAERSYSEEEVLNILQEFKRYLAFGDEVTHSDWFAQFKKK
jgi:hypothetical protein